MGSFYTNVTVLGASIEDVRGVAVGEAFAAGTAEDVVVFAAADDEGHAVTAPLLAGALDRTVVVASVFDDDLLHVEIVDAGGLRGSVTAPDPVALFGLDDEMLADLQEDAAPSGPPLTAESLVQVIGRGDAARAAAVLAGDYVFATDRHAELLAALDLPLVAAGHGFRYLDGDPSERPPGVQLLGDD